MSDPLRNSCEIWKSLVDFSRISFSLFFAKLPFTSTHTLESYYLKALNETNMNCKAECGTCANRFMRCLIFITLK